MINAENTCGIGGPQSKSRLCHNDPSAFTMTTSTAQTSNAPALNPNHHPQISGHRPRSGSAREQTLQAVEYYNSNVLKARVGAGLSAPRSSAHERHFSSRPTSAGGSSSNGGAPANGNGNGNSRLYVYPDHLYRSNSSLELQHDQHSNHHRGSGDGGINGDALHSISGSNGTLRREYGSHGSLDVISPSAASATTSESFFAMLQDYRPAVLGVIGTDQRSPGPAEFLKGKILNHHQQATSAGITTNVHSNGELSLHQSIHEEQNNLDRPSSPKFRTKLHRLWGPGTANAQKLNPQSNKAPSLASPIEERDRALVSRCLNGQLNTMAANTTTNNCTNMTPHTVSTNSADIEERQRRRAFAHYDCQSLTANLGYAAKLRGLLLARRRNTTTGASAASMMNARSATPDTESGDEDSGDGQSNELLENCPFFRNEVGGEEEREVSLTRMQSSVATKAGHQRRAIHRPALACGVSILESPLNESLWKQTCPFQKGLRAIESVDHGARYYRQYFHGEEHQNWFGMEDQLGPVAISIKREKLPEELDNTSTHHQFRLIIRTSELLTLRGSIIEDAIPNPRGPGKPVTTKDVLEYVAPEIQLSCLRQGVNTPQCEQQLMKLDEQGLTNKYKVGILYCKAGQSSEEDMYNNEEAGPEFVEFLETVGKRVRLKGFELYRGGLDNKTDSTGTHSLHATYQDCEIMFHVSTMLPFTPNNRQQLLRKRHIGNDIVTIVFQQPGALPFTPKSIRSQFQHVFIIIQAVNPLTDKTCYKIAVSRSKEVPVFGPPIAAGATYPRGRQFADFLLAKIINAENAAHRSEKFATMATRTRQEYLKDLTSNYCTAVLVDPGPKFSIFPSKKKEKAKPRFSGDAVQRAAFCWQVVLQDSGLSTAVDCFLGISADTFVLIEESTRQLVFVTPTKSILGWSTCGNSLRIYHHQGECVTINMRDCGERDEQLEVIERLRSVTPGCGALELNLRRNPLGQLGFHVQPDGVVTQVENSGQAWAAGLRQGYRLVEICKVAVATLSHDQMVDLLKTSAQVTVTVIESLPDFTPRRGCFQQNCKFNMMNYENDYEGGITNSETSVVNKRSKKSSGAQLQQPSVNHRRRYDRNFSPPRSSNSSGYGTGSSSRSFSIPNEHIRQFTDMGTLTSSSSGHSSNDDRWYDIIENVVDQHSHHQPHIPQQHYQQQQHNLTNGSGVHPRLLESSSLPLMSGNPRPLSIHDPTKVSATINEHNRCVSRAANGEYLMAKAAVNQPHKPVTEAENLMKSLSLSVSDGNSTDTNSVNHEPIYNKSLSTDDEMGADMSPRLRRSATTSNMQKLKSGSITVSSSTSSSRNNSPRPNSEAIQSSVAAKLRPGVTQRNQAHLLQRNSVNYAGSSLQEDLMKLINPDYMTVDDTFINGNHVKNQKNIANSHSLGNISNIGGGLKAAPPAEELLLKKKSRSREGINLGQQPVPELRKSDLNSCESEKAEVIFTTARPATVISQNNSNPSQSSTGEQKSIDENVLYISEGGASIPVHQRRGSGANNRKKYEHASSQPLPLLPDPHEMDWSSLVDTATRAMMMQFHEEQRKLAMETNQQQPGDENSTDYISPMPELQTQLTQLEDRMLRETRRRKSLEQAVRRLTEENRRLQDESQAAVQQLRRFTEWFFQTIDRQS